MMKTRFVVVALLTLAFAVQAFGKTYKSTYSVPCGEVWPAVKDTLGNPDNYNVKESDDAKMTASYEVKHSAHVTVTGAFTQRANKVALVSKGPGCEMHISSSFSGWEHDDKGDFKKRVDDSLVKLKGAPPTQPDKPAEKTK
jgi:hypothetical protein